TEIERVVNAALSEITTVDKSTTTIVPVIEPEDYEGKVFDDSAEVHADKFATKVDCGINHNHNFVDYDNLREMALDNKYEEMGVWGEQPEGYDFINCGKGEVTDAAAAAVKVYYYKQDENGNYVIDEDRPAHYINIDNHACIQSGMSEQISMIAMKQLKEDGTAEYFYAYCADRETPTLTTTTGYYQMVNIEDSDFYGEEAAEKMRAIAENGYWGTEEGVGSLASIKDQLKEKYSEQYNDETATLTVADKDGVEHTFTYKELIDGLKEHEALACTQGAIWNYSNGEIDPETGAKQVVEGVYSAWKFINSRGGELADYYREYDMESDARMQVLYEYLIGLEGEKAEDVIVSAENSFDSTTLVVGEKVGSYIVFDEASGKDVDVNNDDNPDNDAYNTSIEFTLAFIPDDDKDTITVAVWDPVNGKVMTDANGDPIVRTLLKDGSTKEVENGITPDANGAYRLDGLVFQENTGVQFDLKLEGMQNLEQGVYLYQAYGGKEASQTMIGLGAGVQDVDVTKSMTLTFDVDENKTVTAKSKWHKEKHNSFDT
ncbi:MAG: Cys-Gln thioester bond-forming surface protein, partial [Anaerotignum sp.]|nr:Cys-Gln thioester bond-forming surface protein [Anaerotignum sp.]